MTAISEHCSVALDTRTRYRDDAFRHGPGQASPPPTMSDPTESVTSAYTTIIIVAVVVPLAVTVIGLAIVFAYKRQREREFVPPSLANMPGMANSNLPITTPSLPVQVRHVRNVRNGTLLEWPSPSPDASHQGPGTQSSSHPEGESSEASPNPLLDPEARRNVRPELLPTPFNMTYSAAQPPYLVQPFYPPGSSLPYQMPPFGPQAPMLSSSTPRNCRPSHLNRRSCLLRRTCRSPIQIPQLHRTRSIRGR
ncbi:hypothetical protein C8T65DRAFT_28329 [Cerioporus squamosus]|nr:hypothetical protein C8T65DRAFT_28329 [Cerioporus squamosus]